MGRTSCRRTVHGGLQHRCFRREQLMGRGVHPGFELAPEILDRRCDGAGCAVAERAERAPEDVIAHIDEEVDITIGALAAVEALKHITEPPGTFAARSAFTAGFVPVEL